MCPKQPLEAKTDVDHQIAKKYRMLINVCKTTPEIDLSPKNAGEKCANHPRIMMCQIEHFFRNLLVLLCERTWYCISIRIWVKHERCISFSSRAIFSSNLYKSKHQKRYRPNWLTSFLTQLTYLNFGSALHPIGLIQILVAISCYWYANVESQYTL